MKKEAAYPTHFNDLNHIIEGKLRLNLERWIYSIKFDSYAYAIIPSKGFDSMFVLEGFNLAWRREYLDNEFHKIDPILNKARNFQSPNIWSSVTLSIDNQFLNSAKTHGIRFGYSMSLPVNEKYIGVLSVARKNDSFTSQKDSISIIGMISVYLQKLNKYSRNYMDKNLAQPDISPLLTTREKECLLWLAEGKTSWEISRILSISERTAVFHINNCMDKLEAKNRVQVIMKAVRANLIK